MNFSQLRFLPISSFHRGYRRVHQRCHIHRQAFNDYISKSSPLKWALTTLFWLPTGIVFTQYFYALKTVTGRSMQPTLNPDSSAWKDVVVFDRYSVRIEHKYERGDVVALRSPMDSKLIVKRLVGLGGDVIKTLPPYPDAEVRIPEGHAWVEGDEPFRSEDSNYFGPVPLALIDSKLAYIVWPLERIGSLVTPKRPNPKAPRTPAWRKDMAYFEREERRKSRVTASA